MRKSLILLGILNDQDIEWMIRVGTKQAVEPGQPIIREGEDLDSLFIVLGGKLEVSAGGKTVAELASGEIVGEMSLIDARPPSATVTGKEPAWVLSIPREEIDIHVAEDDAFAARLYRAIAVFLSSRLRTTVSNLGYGNKSRLDENVQDEDEIPMHLLEEMNIAGLRFQMLQERARSSGTRM